MRAEVDTRLIKGPALIRRASHHHHHADDVTHDLPANNPPINHRTGHRPSSTLEQYTVSYTVSIDLGGGVALLAGSTGWRGVGGGARGGRGHITLGREKKKQIRPGSAERTGQRGAPVRTADIHNTSVRHGGKHGTDHTGPPGRDGTGQDDGTRQDTFSGDTFGDKKMCASYCAS